MRWAIAQPCMGSIASVRMIRRSRVPWRTSVWSLTAASLADYHREQTAWPILALTGADAVMPYVAASPVRELAVRVAIGADRSRIMRLVLRQGLDIRRLF